ncbi:MAG: DUF3037 domain-containing protein [Ignavibacteriae bacterium]|nr:DUF3037 domain-containing protein [Ignavibacteriota bacterium]
MKTRYSFSVVRYVHDVVGGEFVNVGVALYAPDENFIDAWCTNKYGRLSKLFISVDGDQFRSLMSFLETRIDDARRKLEGEFQFSGKPKDILEILHKIVPKDDSSLQFSQPGGGLATDPKKTLRELFERYVERYSEKKEHAARDDKEVWKIFRHPLEQRRVTKYLQPHMIVTNDYEYEFEHAWKNKQWRVLEPLSFDLENGHSIKDKAAKWLGRAMALQNSKEEFKLYLLLGKPMREELMQAYTKAENILHKIPVAKEFVREQEAESFANSVQHEIEEHEGKP